MDELSFLQMPLPRGFELRLVDIAAGTQIPYEPAAWDDALVVVEAGEVELECTAGGRRTFGTGAVMFLTGLPLRALHNRGPQPALLAAVSRAAISAQQEKTS
jgi:hypothetical protein